MKFLLDQDVYAKTSRFLRDLGHDVIHASELGLSQASDEHLLRVAGQQHRIMVTRDRDFGSLVFVRGIGNGVIYLRLLPSTQNAAHRVLRKVLQTHDETELTHAFVVVEPGGYRIRQL